MRYVVYKRPISVLKENGKVLFGADQWRPAHVGTLTQSDAEALHRELKTKKPIKWNTKIETAK